MKLILNWSNFIKLIKIRSKSINHNVLKIAIKYNTFLSQLKIEKIDMSIIRDAISPLTSHSTVLVVPRKWQTIQYQHIDQSRRKMASSPQHCGEFNFAAAFFCGSRARRSFANKIAVFLGGFEERLLASFVTSGSDERSPL